MWERSLKRELLTGIKDEKSERGRKMIGQARIKERKKSKRWVARRRDSTELDRERRLRRCGERSQRGRSEKEGVKEFE